MQVIGLFFSVFITVTNCRKYE